MSQGRTILSRRMQIQPQFCWTSVHWTFLRCWGNPLLVFGRLLVLQALEATAVAVALPSIHLTSHQDYSQKTHMSQDTQARPRTRPSRLGQDYLPPAGAVQGGQDGRGRGCGAGNQL